MIQMIAKITLVATLIASGNLFAVRRELRDLDDDFYVPGAYEHRRHRQIEAPMLERIESEIEKIRASKKVNESPSCRIVWISPTKYFCGLVGGVITLATAQELAQLDLKIGDSWNYWLDDEQITLKVSEPSQQTALNFCEEFLELEARERIEAESRTRARVEQEFRRREEKLKSDL